MADDIANRLEETTKACLAAYKNWDSKKNDTAALEQLQEAVHELRKVASRLEIDMAISERSDLSDRPLPIPPHKSSRKSRNNNNNNDDNIGNNGDNENGNGNDNGNGLKPKGARRPGRSRIAKGQE